MKDIFAISKSLKPSINMKSLHNQLMRRKIEPFRITIFKKEKISKHLYKLNESILVTDYLKTVDDVGKEMLIEYCCEDIYY